jgi:DNA polymerase I-like protein with 3'-5' exonuclease and polymerase domains
MAGWNLVFDVSWLCAYDLVPYLKKLKWLDGMLLLKRYNPWQSKEEGGIGFGLKENVRAVWPEHGEYAIDATTVATTAQELQDMLVYNYKDAKYSTKLTRIYWDALSKSEKIGAWVECGNIVDVALSYVNGICINKSAITPFHEDINKRIAENEEILGHDISVVRSPKKLAKMIYVDWGYKAIKETPKGEPATDKESLLKLAIKHEKDPRFNALLALRKCNTQGSKFVQSVIKSAEYHGADITRPEPIMSGTYCVPGDVEVLTRSGWVSLKNWTGGDIVQVREDLSMQFLPANKVVAPVATEMISVDHPGMRCLFTAEHTIPHLAQKTDKWRNLKASDLLKKRVFVPTAGTLKTDGFLTKEQMMFLVAYQADAWFDTRRGRVKFTLKKLRKIERLIYLLDINDIKYRKYTAPAYPDRAEIVIEKGSLPSWITKEKKFFDKWILNTEAGGLEAFVRELRFWDGWTHEDGGYGYCSSIEKNVDWAQTAASLAGFKCRKHAESSGIWTIHISDDHVRPIANIVPKTHVRKIACDTPVFCTETVTGYWLARSKGTVFVTGNSHRFTYASYQGKGKDRRQTGIALHQWERGKNARDILTAPEGFLLAEFDFSGQEMRLMAIESEDPVMLELFATGGDGHALMGANIENLDYEYVKNNSDTDSKAKAARNLGKFSNLSLQYRIGIDTMMSRALTQYNLQLWRSKAEHIKHTYLTTYKSVPIYWKEAVRRAAKEGYAFSRGGARVPLSNLNDYQQQQIAINFRIQGTGAEMKLLGINMCRSMFDEDLVYGWDLHDALFMYVRDDANALAKVKKVQGILSNLPYKEVWGWDIPIPLPVDAKLGKTWGSLKGV